MVFSRARGYHRDTLASQPLLRNPFSPPSCCPGSSLGFKIAPRTKKAGFSKLTVWHTDGTEDGQPINANTGLDGWGMTLKLEHELTADGRAVGVIRWGKTGVVSETPR